MSWHFLQEGEAASWPGSCLDGAPDALSKLIPMPAKSCSQDSVTESSNVSRSGTTYEHSMGVPGAEISMSLPPDSPVRTSVKREKVLASRARSQVCGKRPHELLTKYDHASRSWKIPTCLPIAGLGLSLETWPISGSMRNGVCFQRATTLPAVTQDDASTSLLTPTAQAWRAWTFRNLQSLIRKNHAPGNLQEQLAQRFLRMITPECHEILMRWPQGWTDLKSLGTDGFHKWLFTHGMS